MLRAFNLIEKKMVKNKALKQNIILKKLQNHFIFKCLSGKINLSKDDVMFLLSHIFTNLYLIGLILY